MREIYARVTPIYSSPASVYTAAIESGINLFHSIVDEQVCGYSLNKNIEFFDSLEEAINTIRSAAQISAVIELRHALKESEKAILTLEVDNKNEIKKVVSIGRYEYFCHSFVDEGTQWITQPVQLTDLSANALQKINDQYQNHLSALCKTNNGSQVETMRLSKV